MSETWIYREDGRARVIDLEDGAPAPRGWSLDPNVIADESKRTAEAVTDAWIKERHLPFEADPESAPAAEPEAAEAPVAPKPKRR